MHTICGSFVWRMRDKSWLYQCSCDGHGFGGAGEAGISHCAFKYLSNQDTVRSIASIRSSRFANP